MKLKSIGCILVLFLTTNVLLSQEVYNQTDAEGKRHGKWKGTYPDSNKLRYIGQFEHGKEIGRFTYYDKLNSKIVIATREFSTDGSCFVVFYNGKNKVSEGMMKDKMYIGEWRYFHKNSPALMTLENYTAGKLNGVRKVFYEDGVIAEIALYKDGLKEGVTKVYNKKGVLIEEANYLKGMLDGSITYYESDGTLSIQGHYKEDLAVGVWSYYRNAQKYKEEKKGSRYKKRN